MSGGLLSAADLQALWLTLQLAALTTLLLILVEDDPLFSEG